jgi:hypothetical protein
MFLVSSFAPLSRRATESSAPLQSLARQRRFSQLHRVKKQAIQDTGRWGREERGERREERGEKKDFTPQYRNVTRRDSFYLFSLLRTIGAFPDKTPIPHSKITTGQAPWDLWAGGWITSNHQHISRQAILASGRFTLQANFIFARAR